MRFEITGIDMTLATLQRLKTEFPPQMVQSMAETTAEAARPITHVITGALRGSHTAFRVSNLEWHVAPNPGTINPFGYRPAQYGGVEHARGGSHAFYERTLNERMPDILRDSIFEAFRRFI